MDSLISVIIPVYNVAHYLISCVESITASSYRNLQILLIDDGSTDGSGPLCDRLALTDSRITVRHTDNGGISHARNVGLSLATGDYISFIDSDDLIHPDFYRLMLSAMIHESADLVICHEQIFSDSSVLPSMEACHTYHLQSIESQDGFFLHFMDPFTGPVTWVWNKLYRRSLLSDIHFQEGKKMEDISFLTDYALQCQKVVWLEETLNYYRQRKDSTMEEGFSDISCDYADALLYSLDRIQASLEASDFSAAYAVYVTNKLALLCVKSRKYHWQNSFSYLAQKYRDSYKRYHQNAETLSARGKLFLARYCFPLYYMLQKNRIRI